MRFTIRGARLVDASLDVPEGDIAIDDARIRAVGQVEDMRGSSIDATNTIVMPGFIDVHTHGGGGFSLHTSDAQEIHAYSCWVPQTGVTSFHTAAIDTHNPSPHDPLPHPR